MKLFLRTILLILAITAVSCRSAPVETGSEAMYSTLVEQADAIFVGRVDYVSDINANGQHQVAFTVTEPIVDSLNLGSGVVLTAVPTAELFVGNEFIVFANQETIETGGGKTAVLRLIQSDGNGFVAVDARDLILNVVAQ